MAILQEQWEAAKTRAERRRNQLNVMLSECRQFHFNFADLEQWLAKVEADLDSTPIRPESPQGVATLLRHHEVSVSCVLVESC